MNADSDPIIALLSAISVAVLGPFLPSVAARQLVAAILVAFRIRRPRQGIRSSVGPQPTLLG
ncbi:hypothetical protein AB0B06_28325 [Streptomyces sp. NPDC044989]|uniref:hypothetical protein n=1 Tax=Streptomyces sp. NPDC044989 TaxID=3154336 RepID=UPI0033E1D63A